MECGLRAWGSILVTWLVLASLGLLGCTSSTVSVSSGSTQTTQRTTTTSATTSPTISSSASAVQQVAIQFDLGPADEISFQDAWLQIADRAKVQSMVDAKAYEFHLDFSTSGAFVGMEILVTRSAEKVLKISWDGRDGPSDQHVLATVSVEDRPTYPPAIADDRLSLVLIAIDVVGPAQMLEKMPDPGSAGYYEIGWWPPEESIQLDQSAYMWNGSVLDQTTASFGTVNPGTGYIWIPAISLVLDDGGGVTATTSSSASAPVHFFVPWGSGNSLQDTTSSIPSTTTTHPDLF